MLKFNVSALTILSPSDQYWWLPDVNEKSIQWPIAKVMGWTYAVTKTNQTRFHFPDFGLVDNYRLSQNLENASRWSMGNNLPSWGSLLKNLNDSLTAMEQAQSIQHRRTVDGSTLDSFRTVLFIARFSTSIFIELERQFGTEFVLDVTTHLKKQDYRLSRIHDRFKKKVTSTISSHHINKPTVIDHIWFDETQAFWELKALEIECGSKCIDSRFIEKNKNGFNTSDLKSFLSYLDSFTLYPYLKQAQSNVITLAPPAYFDLLLKGLKLRKSADASPKNIELYVDEIKFANLEGHFLWLVNWIWATFHYRREEDNLAFPFYLKAFENGKYSAGHNQYLLVNQFVECCAKNNKWRDFKKGIAWANYLGIKVRWYRGLDESNERLKTAYEYLKIARYAQV